MGRNIPVEECDGMKIPDYRALKEFERNLKSAEKRLTEIIEKLDKEGKIPKGGEAQSSILKTGEAT